MRSIRVFVAVVIVAFLAVSCQQKKKIMTMEDYIKIDLKIAETDQKPESKEKVVKQFGYTLEQFNDFAKKVESDPKLIEKRGELMLKQQKAGKK